MGKKNKNKSQTTLEPPQQTPPPPPPLLDGDTNSYEPKTPKQKKRKHQQQQPKTNAPSSELTNNNAANSNSPQTKEKTKTKNKKHKVKVILPTVSIAIPSTIIGNAQSHELATRLAGQIARAATIFRIHEIVVFDNNGNSMDDPSVTGNFEDDRSNAAFFIRILRYLETPQYLRRTLFSSHKCLRFVGLLPPLDAPHHLRKHEWASYREGVTLEEKTPNSVGTLVDVGLDENVAIDKVLGPGIRVTVAMGTDRSLSTGTLRQVVESSTPRQEEGTYWGYKVRYAPNLSSVFENSSYEGGYDHVIGTSEHGKVVKSSALCIPAFRHLLIAFGGLAGLEECIDKDKKLKGKDAQTIFHSYLNLCPHQGSRTIRSEEAVFIALQYFQEPIERASEEG